VADHQISEADLRPRGPPSGRARLALGEGCNRCRDSSGAGVRAFGGLHAVVDGEALPSTERREERRRFGRLLQRKHELFREDEIRRARIRPVPTAVCPRSDDVSQASRFHFPLGDESLRVRAISLRPVRARAARREPLEKRLLIERMPDAVDPPPGDRDDDTFLPGHAGSARAFLEHPHPQLARRGVVLLQPCRELFA